MWFFSSNHIPTFYFVLRHVSINTFMISILPKPDHYLLLSHTSYHDTWHHIPLSIRMRCRSVFDHFGCAFIHLLDFRFNIFHDGRAWQIVDLVVKMIFILTIGMLSVELLALCILSIDHHCFIHRSILFFFVNMVSQYMVLFSITYLRLDIFIAYWGIATYLDVLTLRFDFLFMIVVFDGLWSYWYLGFSLLGILGWS